MTLTDFLLARIAEDEEWARWAGAAQDAELSRGLAFVSSLGSSSVASAGRVLAECEAKRRIVADLAEAGRDGSGRYEEGYGLSTAMAHLAAVYADHPDYDEAWRP